MNPFCRTQVTFPAGTEKTGVGIERWILLLLGLILVVTSGCASHRRQGNAMERAWEQGEVERAADLAERLAERRSGRRDDVLWYLEAGRTLQAAGRYEESRESFRKAAEQIAERDEEWERQMVREIGAALTNLSHLPYRATQSDRIMLEIYQTLNELAMDRPAEARIHLNRLQARQQEAVEEWPRRLQREKESLRTEAATESRGERRSMVQPERAAADERFQRQFREQYGPLEQFQKYDEYLNPMAWYLEGLVFMHRPQIPADLERARFAFRRLRGLVPDHPVLEADGITLEEVLRGERPGPYTYVFLETGLAPEKEEIRLDFPLFLVSGDVPYFGAAFPSLRFRGNYDSYLEVQGGEQRERTVLVADMDAILATEFREELPLIVTKTLTSAGLKAAAVYGVRELARRESGTLGSLVNLFGWWYQSLMNEADLRSWRTLPKQWQVARVDTPESGEITLWRAGREESWKLDLPPGVIHIVFVRLPSRGATPSTQILVLR